MLPLLLFVLPDRLDNEHLGHYQGSRTRIRSAGIRQRGR